MNTLSKLPQPTETPTFTTYDARELMNDGSQVCIVLDGQKYFLRITRAGKLILTK
ncbi:MAG: hemin uptake protein HemP [Pseudomonadota bacterium]